MWQIDNASMEETYKAEVECLRKVLAEKEAEIKRLHELLDLYDKKMSACDCDEYGVKWTERV